MKIDKHTKLKHIIPLLTEQRLNDLIDQVEEYPLKQNLLDFTIKQFGEITLDQEKYLSTLLAPNQKALVALGKLKSFKRQLQEISNFMKMCEIPQSKEEKAAAVNIKFPDPIARMLITVTQFFHLKSFKEAEEIKLADYLLIMQEQYSAAMYQRNYQKIINQRTKKKL